MALPSLLSALPFSPCFSQKADRVERNTETGAEGEAVSWDESGLNSRKCAKK